MPDRDHLIFHIEMKITISLTWIIIFTSKILSGVPSDLLGSPDECGGPSGEADRVVFGRESARGHVHRLGPFPLGTFCNFNLL